MHTAIELAKAGATHEQRKDFTNDLVGSFNDEAVWYAYRSRSRAQDLFGMASQPVSRASDVIRPVRNWCLPTRQVVAAVGAVLNKGHYAHSAACRTLVFTLFILTCGAALAASGPRNAWNVFTLPNPEVTPNWRTYAPPRCQSDPDACAQDNRFWEEWDFSHFQTGIDSSFAAVGSQGQYQAVMIIMPLGDTRSYLNNIQLIYQSAARHGVGLQAVLFPKWKYGEEYCYLYNSNAPSGCQLVSGTTVAVAYRKLINLMNFMQNLGSACTSGTYNMQFAIWYGWSNFSPGYGVLKNFWQSLPAGTCNLRASYITWLDTNFSGTSAVQRLQKYAVTRLNQPYWVNTELYSTSQVQRYDTTYAPYQTIITGYWGATDVASWALGMCSQWNTALQPVHLGIWTFYDRDVPPIEEYRSYIDGSMAVIGSICTY